MKKTALLRGKNKALGVLADAARLAANRASDSIDETLAFVEASNKRIEAMESHSQPRAKKRVSGRKL